MIEILIFGAIVALFAAKKNAVDTKQAVISAVKQEPKPTPEPLKKSDLGIETPVFTPTPPPVIKEEPEEKTTGKTFFDTPEETKQEPIPAPKPEQPVIYQIFDDPLQIKPEKPAFFDEPELDPKRWEGGKAAPQYNPLSKYWSLRKYPTSKGVFIDAPPAAQNTPEFRRERVGIFLFWFFLSHPNAIPYRDWSKYLNFGNTSTAVMQKNLSNLFLDGRLEKYCLENNIEIEREIWQFEQNKGFGDIEPHAKIPPFLGTGGSQMPGDDSRGFMTGWPLFGIEYPADIKAQFVAYEIDVKFKYGTIEKMISERKKPIWQCFKEDNLNLTPIYGLDLEYINKTQNQTYGKKSDELIFIEYLEKMPNIDEYVLNNHHGGIIQRQFPAYQALVKKHGKEKGHNEYFKARFPEHWTLVEKQTKEEKKADQEAYNAWLAAELAKKEAAAAEAAKITGITIDKAIEVINKFAAVPLRATGPGANEANKRIQRFMDVQIQQYGTEGAYTRYLKANGLSFWTEMLAYESANGLTWTENPRYVIDAETGQGTTIKQAQSNYFAARVPSSQMILGRFYVSEPGKCYIKDTNGQTLYNPIIYGDTLENGRYTLQTDSKGTFYILK